MTSECRILLETAKGWIEELLDHEVIDLDGKSKTLSTVMKIEERIRMVLERMDCGIHPDGGVVRIHGQAFRLVPIEENKSALAMQ